MGGANRDVRQKFGAGQADTLMGTTPYVWSTDKVELLLCPGDRLTWEMWSTVPIVSETFICENGYRGTQFILLWHGIGPVGYGQLLARSGGRSSTTINAFPDPYDKVIAGTALTIEFYGYRGSIAPTAMRECIGVASSDVVRHLLESDSPMTLEAPSYSWSADGVSLFLTPAESLTWHKWALIPIWIQEFVTENGFKGTQFVLLWEGFGDVGSGQLVNTSVH